MASVAHRLSVGLLESAWRVRWGFRPHVVTDLVTALGPSGSISWFASNTVPYERTRKRWGPIRTHLVASAISILDGCRYGSRSHVAALQLHYLDVFGALFPLDDDAFSALHDLDAAEAMTRLHDAVRASALDDDVPLIERTIELRDDPSRATSDDDARLMQLIEMLAVSNACALEAGTEADQAHDPINKDRALREQYSMLRTKERDAANPHRWRRRA